MAESCFESFCEGRELSKLISCVFCKKQKLTQLVQLECFHLSCKVCLQSKLEDPKPGTAFNCPECDMLCKVPMGGVDKFPDEPLQHKMHQITAIFSDKKPNCKLCEQVNAKASSVCILCKINLCEKDAKCHQGVPGHKVVTHQEVCVEPNFSLMLKSKVVICQEHNLEKTYFCKTCQQKICPKCAASKHSDHKKDSAVNIANKYKKQLEENIRDIKKAERIAKENIEMLEKDFLEIQGNHQKLVEKLHDKSTGGNNRKEILQKIDEGVKDKNRLTFQITRENNKILQCKSAQSYITVFLKFSSYADVIENFQDLQQNCGVLGEWGGTCFLSDKMQGIGLNEKECQERKTWSGLEKKVDEIEGIKGKRPRASQLEFKEVGSSCNHPSMDRYSLHLTMESNWPGMAVYEGDLLLVGHKGLARFSFADSRNVIQPVDLSESDAWNIEVFQGDIYVSDKRKRAVLIFDKDGKEKRKLYLPENDDGGTDKINWYKAIGLTIDGINKDIYVSSVYTSIIYKFEQKSPQSIPWITDGLDRPAYLCTTQDQHLVVSNWGSKTVQKYNPQGQHVWSYGQGLLSFPWGVCSDPLGHIFIGDFSNHRVIVVHNEGSYLMKIDLPDTRKISCVRISNRRLFVTTQSGHVYVFKIIYS